jgi:hypothetical protein
MQIKHKDKSGICTVGPYAFLKSTIFWDATLSYITELFITTAVRTLNPTNGFLFWACRGNNSASVNITGST